MNTDMRFYIHSMQHAEKNHSIYITTLRNPEESLDQTIINLVRYTYLDIV